MNIELPLLTPARLSLIRLWICDQKNPRHPRLMVKHLN